MQVVYFQKCKKLLLEEVIKILNCWEISLGRYVTRKMAVMLLHAQLRLTYLYPINFVRTSLSLLIRCFLFTIISPTYSIHMQIINKGMCTLFRFRRIANLTVVVLSSIRLSLCSFQIYRSLDTVADDCANFLTHNYIRFGFLIRNVLKICQFFLLEQNICNSWNTFLAA